MGFGHRQLFKHKTQPGGASGGYVSPYLLEILSTRSGAPSWLCAAGTLVANTGQTVSCSRASSGYCLGSDGLLHLLGNNTVRVEPTGLLVEGASTNQFVRSGDLSHASWLTDTALASAVQNATSPDGTANSAWTLTNASAGAGIRFYQNVGTGTDTLSVYAKAGTARYLWIHTVAAATVVWDWNTLSFGAVTGSGTASYDALANGWYRLKLSTTAGAVAINAFAWANSITNPQFQVPDGTSAILWLPQSETQQFATSPIVTGAGSASRASDLISVTNPLAALSQPVPAWRMGTTGTPLPTWALLPSQPNIHLATGTNGAANTVRLLPSQIVANHLTLDVTDAGGGYKAVTESTGATGSAAFTFTGFDTSAGAMTSSPAGTTFGAGTGICSAFGATLYIGYVPPLTDTFRWWGHLTDIVVHNT